jgi:phytoene desaturase (3,4-didehydrolycopene-forming)
VSRLQADHQSYHLSLQRFVGRNFYHLPEYFSLQNLPLLFKMKALVKHYDNIGHYFHDPHLKAAFTFQNMYLGLSPFDAPATYSLVQYTELADGVWYPVGGIYHVIESLARVAEEHGVHFVYNSPVKQIEVDGNRATGMVLQDGSHMSADVIVANCDCCQCGPAVCLLALIARQGRS